MSRSSNYCIHWTAWESTADWTQYCTLQQLIRGQTSLLDGSYALSLAISELSLDCVSSGKQVLELYLDEGLTCYIIKMEQLLSKLYTILILFVVVKSIVASRLQLRGVRSSSNVWHRFINAMSKFGNLPRLKLGHRNNTKLKMFSLLDRQQIFLRKAETRVQINFLCLRNVM